MPVKEDARPWRSWYNVKEWYRLRAQVLRRDSVEAYGRIIPKCRKTGVLLTGKPPAANSPVVDHVRPHKGNRELFFDPSNLQTVSKAWHDSAKQRQERGSRVPVDVDGWPKS